MCLLGNETGPTPSCMRRTGDRGWVSRDGSVYFAGRLDRQIKRQGHRLRLDFIEEVRIQVCLEYSVTTPAHLIGPLQVSVCDRDRVLVLYI